MFPEPEGHGRHHHGWRTICACQPSVETVFQRPLISAAHRDLVYAIQYYLHAQSEYLHVLWNNMQRDNYENNPFIALFRQVSTLMFVEDELCIKAQDFCSNSSQHSAPWQLKLTEPLAGPQLNMPMPGFHRLQTHSCLRRLLLQSLADSNKSSSNL